MMMWGNIRHYPSNIVKRPKMVVAARNSKPISVCMLEIVPSLKFI